MNIGFIYGQKTYPAGMGGSVHGYQLIKGLTARGHKLYTWLYGHDDNPYITHLRGRQFFRFITQIDILYIRINRHVLYKSTKLLFLLISIKKYFRHDLPIIWEFNGEHDESLFLGVPPKKIARLDNTLKKYARFVDCGIGVSETISNFIKEHYHIKKTRCVPNGSDLTLFYPEKKEFSRALHVAWIGGAKWPWHDIDNVLKAARILENTNITFSIYGNIDQSKYSISQNVLCKGIVPYRELGTHLNKMHVGLHILKPFSGRYLDLSPLKVFDYMASGCAIMTQPDGQRGKIINEWDCGVLTDGSPEDIAEKLLHLSENSDYCLRLGENGRKAAEAYFNWNRVVNDIEYSMLELIKNHG